MAGQNFHENRAKFDQISPFNRSARQAITIPLASGREWPHTRVWSKTYRLMVRESWRKTGRCLFRWRQRKNLGSKKTPQHGRVHVDLSCNTCMSTPSRSFRRRHTTHRGRQWRWWRAQPEEKQVVAVVCEVREPILITRNTALLQSGPCRCVRHTLTVSAKSRL